MSATKRKSRSETRKRLKERKKKRKPKEAREQPREPRRPYASARSKLKVVGAALVAVTALCLFVPTVVAAIKLLLISSFGDFLAVAWEWGWSVVLILFAAAFLHVSLLAYKAIFDIGENTRELLTLNRKEREEPAEEDAESEPDDEVDTDGEAISTEDGPQESEDPSPAGPGACRS